MAGNINDYWNTQYGGYQEPLGGELSGINQSVAGHPTDFSRWVQNQQNTSFGTDKNPGILGTGAYGVQDFTQNGPNSGLYNQLLGQIDQGGQNAANMNMPQFDPTQSDAARAQQMTLIQQLQDQASGVGPSLAQMQFKQASDQNIANAMAMGASQRGAGQAGGLYNVQNQQAGIAQGMAGTSAQLRLQEQMAARNALGGVLGGMRGQDIQQAGLAQQGGLQAQQVKNQAMQFYLQQGMNLMQAQQQANEFYNQLAQQEYEAQRKANDQLVNTAMGAISGGMTSAGSKVSSV